MTQRETRDSGDERFSWEGWERQGKWHWAIAGKPPSRPAKVFEIFGGQCHDSGTRDKRCLALASEVPAMPPIFPSRKAKAIDGPVTRGRVSHEGADRLMKATTWSRRGRYPEVVSTSIDGASSETRSNSRYRRM